MDFDDTCEDTARPVAAAAVEDMAALDPAGPALLGPLAPGSIALIRGPRGVGKSWLGLAMARAIAGGGTFLGWTTRAAPVLYVEAAMSGALLGARLRALGDAPGLHIVCDEALDLADLDDQARLMDVLPDDGVLVLDGLSLLVRAGREGWDSFMRWLRMLRRSGHAVVLVDTALRPPIVALADTLLTLKPRSSDADLSFTLAIASRLPLAAADRMVAVALAVTDGKAAWSRTASVPPELRAVVEAARDGGTMREIAARLGLPLATAWRRVDRAKALGLIERDETDGTPQHAPARKTAADGRANERMAGETGGTARTDLAAVSTAVLKRTLARREALQGRAQAHRPGPAILAGYDDAELAAECARRMKLAQACVPMAAE